MPASITPIVKMPTVSAGKWVCGSFLNRLYQQSPFGMGAALFCGVTTSSFFALGPIYALHLGLDTTGVAVFMACGTLGGFALTWPLGWLSDQIDRRFVIIGAAIIAAATLLLLAIFIPRDAPRWIVYLCIAIVGGTIVPTYSVVLAHVNDAVGKGEFAAASGGLLLVQGAGAVIGPLLAGFAMSHLRRGLAFTIISAQVLIAVFGLYRMKRRAVIPRTHKRAFAVEPPVPVSAKLEAKHSIDSSP